MIDRALAAPAPAPALTLTLTVIRGGRSESRPADAWWERRSRMRQIVGGCPDHWWSNTAPRTGRCTCDRFTG